MKNDVNKLYLLKSNLRILTKILLVGIFLIFQLNAFSQQKTITGTIADENGSPLPGVSIVVKGSTIGTITDTSGKFELTVPADAQILVFSFMGMKEQEITIGDLRVLNVVMEEDVIGMDEVVVVGYGTARKATITGSIAKVEGETLEVAKTTNFSNALIGRLPGFVAVLRSGLPGADEPTIRIRGSNTLNNNNPLIVIDGIPGRSMSRLSASDVESLTILKDASAAIYGARAANGVILITTKRGATDKLKTSFSFNQGFASPTVLPNMASSWLYASMMNEVDMYAGLPARFSDDDIQKFKDGTQPYSHPNTDWFSEVFKPYSLENNANISFNGGTENLSYFVSIGTRFQDATYQRSGANYSQANFRSNIDGKISKNISISLDLAGRQENRQFPVASQSVTFRIIPRGKPTDVAWWFGKFPGPDVESDRHPGVMVSDIPGYDKSRTYIMESNLRLNIDIPWVEGLSVTGNASIDKNFMDGKLWQIPFYLYVWDKTSVDSDGLPSLSRSKRGISEPRLDQRMNNGQRVTTNALINYSTKIAEKHRIKLLAGTEAILGYSGNFSALRKFYVSEAIPELFAGGDLEKDNAGSSSEYARMNYFGRVNYDYLSKYLLEFVWRYDGSYIFPEEKRWGFFPGFSLGWILSEEEFWRNNIAFLNFFKIRGSWGQTGNDRIAEFQYLATYGFGRNMYNGYDGNQFVTGVTRNPVLREAAIPNTNVTWEVANQTNIGFDAQMLGGRLTFTGDYFYNIRSNILTQRAASIPFSTGLTLPPENIGEVVNQGFEFDIGYGDQSGDFGYNVSFNAGYAKNKITFWDETPGIPEYQQTTGYPMHSSLYYQAIGIFKDQDHVDSYPSWVGARPGDIIFEDVNDDGKIDGLDRKRDYRGQIPHTILGVNVDLTYKNFYATALIQGAFGKIRYHYVESGEAGNYYMVDAEGRWTPDNIDANKPRAFSYVGEYWRANANTYWLRSADYVRLKNLEVGYNMPVSIISKLGMDKLRIYFGGLNLITWCPEIQDFDPESNYQDYPLHKVLNMGITINF